MVLCAGYLGVIGEMGFDAIVTQKFWNLLWADCRQSQTRIWSPQRSWTMGGPKPDQK